MIVQISMVRNELPLIKQLLPIWKKYVDGFIFMLDTNTDQTKSYLKSVSSEYNILEVLENTQFENELTIETDIRQRLFDSALKYTNKIICLDADEYIDGIGSKKDLEELLDKNPNTRFHLKWNQYTSCNTIRIDGPWDNNYKERIGVYQNRKEYIKSQNHSQHLPQTEIDVAVNPETFFIAHLQWLNKNYVAIKQYYWKVYDYVNKIKYGIDTVGSEAYDASVNNFNWEEEYIFFPLRISPYVFEKDLMENNYRLNYIKENVQAYDIPNLGDWGLDIVNLNSKDSNPYKVSVITAIGKNGVYSKYFQRYLENVLDQHMFLQTEHVIVYSEWHEFFDNFKKYSNFILVKEDRRLGVYNAWNIGIKNASTDYVTNWNIDDIRHPINTKIKYDLLSKNNIDLAYNYYTGVSDDTINFYSENWLKNGYIPYPDDYHNIVLHACMAGPDPMWKKQLHDKVGYFDYENFNTIGDWEMWIRFVVVANAKFKLIPEVLCIYLDHENTVSRTNLKKVEDEKIKLSQKYMK
jgi:hypothetical protein